MEKGRQQHVAVVGSGMAGLVIAYLLHNDAKQRYAVTVLEEVKLLLRKSVYVFWTVLTAIREINFPWIRLPYHFPIVTAPMYGSTFLCARSLADTIVI